MESELDTVGEMAEDGVRDVRHEQFTQAFGGPAKPPKRLDVNAQGNHGGSKQGGVNIDMFYVNRSGCYMENYRGP